MDMLAQLLFFKDSANRCLRLGGEPNVAAGSSSTGAMLNTSVGSACLLEETQAECARLREEVVKGRTESDILLEDYKVAEAVLRREVFELRSQLSVAHASRPPDSWPEDGADNATEFEDMRQKAVRAESSLALALKSAEQIPDLISKIVELQQELVKTKVEVLAFEEASHQSSWGAMFGGLVCSTAGRSSPPS